MQQPSSSRLSGLTQSGVEQSRRLHGANILTPCKPDPWWKLYFEKFDDPVIRILMIAGVIAIVAGAADGHFVEGIGIIIAVLLATALAFLNEYKANQEFDILNKVNDEVPVKVLRDGAYCTVPRRDIVVGDFVLLELREEIPADGSVLEGVRLQVEESKFTGESLPVTKHPSEHAGPACVGRTAPDQTQDRGNPPRPAPKCRAPHPSSLPRLLNPFQLFLIHDILNYDGCFLQRNSTMSSRAL